MNPPVGTTPFVNDSTQPTPGAARELAAPRSLRTPGSLAQLLRTSPELAADRSLVIEKAVDEYQLLLEEEPHSTLDEYCRQFAFLSSSLQSSIYRQLEVERFVCQNNWVQRQLSGEEWPKPGEQRGDFHVLEELGRGGLSRAYLCTQPKLGSRQVVVKFGTRSVAEADMLGRLAHPHIVPIYSAESDGDHRLTVLCMPFLGRSTLYDFFSLDHCDRSHPARLQKAAAVWEQPSDRIEEHLLPKADGPFYFPYESAAYVGASLASALAHAHSRGVVHGDVKPSNILLARSGVPLLMDFNLSGDMAKSVVAHGGTLPYMPPEQLRCVALNDGNAGRYDHRSDIYSLGVVLYEALSGRLPFFVDASATDAESLAKEMLRQQQLGHQLLHAVAPQVPASLCRAVDSCLSFHPDDRVQAAGELEQLFQRELKPLRRWMRRTAAHPRLAASAAVLALTLGAWQAYAWATRPPAEVRSFEFAMELQADNQLLAAKEAFERALDLRPDFIEARFELGRNAIRRNELDQAQYAFKRVDQLERSARSAAYRGYCWGLKGNLSASIPFYERAIETGCDAPEVYNNLGHAYQLGLTWRSPREQCEEAKKCLARALEQWPSSPTVRMNWVRLAKIRRQFEEPNAVDAEALDVCRQLLGEFPDCGPIQMNAAIHCRYLGAAAPQLRDEGVEHLIAAVRLGYGPSKDDLEASDFWRPFKSSPLYPALLKAAAAGKPQRSGTVIPAVLEPVSLATPPSALRNAQ